MEQLLAEATWLALVGAVQASHLQLAGRSDRPLLLVPPDQAAADALIEGWAEPWPAHWSCQPQWVGAEGGDQPWYHYSDPRLDGPLPLGAWREHYPNLQLDGMELRPQARLEEVLAAWPPSEADGGLLLLVGVDGAVIGAGMAPITARLRQLLWWPGEPAEALPPPAEAALLEAALVPDTATPVPSPALAWRRDPLHHQLTRLHQERDELAAERNGLLAERDGLLAERDALASARDALAAERDGVAAERDGLAAERNGLVAERDGLLAERNALAAERDGVAAECDGLAAERNGLIAERDGLEQRLELINQELDAILALIDSANPASATADIEPQQT
jgi:hypothetical protein